MYQDMSQSLNTTSENITSSTTNQHHRNWGGAKTRRGCFSSTNRKPGEGRSMQCAAVFPTAKSLLTGNERHKKGLTKVIRHSFWERFLWWGTSGAKPETGHVCVSAPLTSSENCIRMQLTLRCFLFFPTCTVSVPYGCREGCFRTLPPSFLVDQWRVKKHHFADMFQEVLFQIDDFTMEIHVWVSDFR